MRRTEVAGEVSDDTKSVAASGGDDAEYPQAEQNRASGGSVAEHVRQTLMTPRL